jgi:hypothetical protein
MSTAPAGWTAVDEAPQGWTEVSAPTAPAKGLPPPPRATPGAESITGLSATPKPTGVAEKAERWLGDAANDVRYGTGTTVVGRGLKKMGAEGTAMGAPPEVGEFMASPELGTLRAAKGAMELPQEGKRWQGTKDVVGGAMQAAQIPSSVLVPELSSDALDKTPKLLGSILEQVFGNTKRAAEGLEKVSKVVGKDPLLINPTLLQRATRIQELADSGGHMPKVVGDFLKRLDATDKGPINFDTARDFAVNVGKLSVDETNKMNGPQKRQVALFAHDLAESLNNTAKNGGNLKEYRAAIDSYHRAMQTRRAIRAAGKVALTGGAAYAGKKLILDKLP